MATKLDELKQMMDKLGLRDEGRAEYVTRPNLPSTEGYDEPQEEPNRILERDNAPKKDKQRVESLKKFNETNKKVSDSTAAIGELRELERDLEKKGKDTKKPMRVEVPEELQEREESLDYERLARGLADTSASFLDNLDKAYARMGAANIAYQGETPGTPIETGIVADSGMEEELLEERREELKAKRERFKSMMDQLYKKAMIEQMGTSQELKKEEAKRRAKKEEFDKSYKQQLLEQRKEAEDRRIEKQERSALDKIYRVTQDFEKNPVKKQLDKQGLSFREADSLIESIEEGNEVALGALGTKMARAMGEVGVLTDQDVKRYIQAQSVVQSAKDSFGRAWRGKVSEETMKDIQNVTDKMRRGFTKKKKEIQKKYMDRAYNLYGKPAGIDKETVYEQFMPIVDEVESEAAGEEEIAAYEPEQQEAGYSDREERAIEVVMKNNNVSRERAINALKSAGKLK